jgi:hypothetical protein
VTRAGVLPGLLGGAALAIALVASAACRPPRFLTGPRLSGTCEGACDHYFACKGDGPTEVAKTRCVADCHDVFSDEDSLRAYESLGCDDAVEYVDGARARAAGADGHRAGSNASR